MIPQQQELLPLTDLTDYLIKQSAYGYAQWYAKEEQIKQSWSEK